MNNNDILRRIRYIFDHKDTKIIAIFAEVEYLVTSAQVVNWLKKEDDPEFCELSDIQLASFLNGLINDKRGKKDGPLALPEKQLNNNIIFRKLKIALDLKAEDILAILQKADLRISKHELSAFFRKSSHKHYRECLDQILRNFLHGLQLKYRDSK